MKQQYRLKLRSYSTTIQHLPGDIIVDITIHLDVESVAKFLGTCKAFWKLRHRSKIRNASTFILATKEKRWNTCLCYIEDAEESWVEYFIKKGATDINRGLLSAVIMDNFKLVKILVGMGADNIARAKSMCRNPEILEYLNSLTYSTTLKKGGRFSDKMYRAAEKEDMNKIQKLLKNGDKRYNSGLKGAAYVGNWHLMGYFMKLGANDWKSALLEAVVGCCLNGIFPLSCNAKCSPDVIDFLIQRGANNLRLAAYYAVFYESKEVIEYMVNKNYVSWDICLEEAQSLGYAEMIKFCTTKKMEARKRKEPEPKKASHRSKLLRQK